MKTPVIVDHFCGAGGESTGIMQAVEEMDLKVELHAHNHWARAIETHSHNHPDAIHRQAMIEDLDPVKCVPGQRVALMWASPECTHHSVARGGRPCSDQSRATAMHVVKWLQELYVERLIVENVPEFLNWGPLGANGKPMESKRGATFRAWVGMIESLGYKVEHRILKAADYGDPTSRRRLFVQAVRSHKKIIWPEPTHTEEPDMFGSKPWVPARDIIDWSIPGESIFTRKKPLAEATLRRIEHGIGKYWGEWAEPFLCILRGTSTTRSIDLPMPTITAGGGHVGIVEPMLLGQQSGATGRPVSMPSPTVATSGAISLVEPFMLSACHGGGDQRRIYGLDKPVGTLPCTNRFGITTPFLVQYYGNGEARNIHAPLDTVTCNDRFALVQGNPVQLDIRFRMLQPHELSAAQGFPGHYWFSGTKTDQVKQIGNAVPVGTAKALALAAMADMKN